MSEPLEYKIFPHCFFGTKETNVPADPPHTVTIHSVTFLLLYTLLIIF